MTIALLANRGHSEQVFAERHFDRLRTLGAFVDARFIATVDEVLDRLGEAEAVLSTWGMPRVDERLLAAAPKLRGIFYAAGSVKGFVTPDMWDRGIVVSSAARVNAIPVAEYTVAAIFLTNKRFWNVVGTSKHAVGPGNYRRTVGLIAASLVGREVIRLLKDTDLEILLCDPFVSEEEAKRLGARKVDMEELMSQSDVVSLHAPNLPHLRHMIDARLLVRMKDGATFINTARPDLVDEQALAAELQSERIWAVLDVSSFPAPSEDGPFQGLRNVVYTPHMAGSVGQECHRMADFAIDELERFLKDEPLLNQVTREALAYLA